MVFIYSRVHATQSDLDVMKTNLNISGNSFGTSKSLEYLFCPVLSMLKELRGSDRRVSVCLNYDMN